MRIAVSCCLTSRTEVGRCSLAFVPGRSTRYNVGAPQIPGYSRLAAMSDKWDFYFAKVNGEVASLFVDLGIRDKSPDPGRPHLIWSWIYMNQPREDGLSSSDEAQALWTIEEDMTASLQGMATFVGRITTAGRREFYFYADDSKRCEIAISAAMAKHPAYRFDL